jgi:uncharacterized protein YjbI with pentapeptide repeats
VKPSELKDILEQHHLWVESDYKQGERANLHGADLRGVNLHGADLRGVNLQGVNLQGVNLHGADLRGVNLHGANLHGANLDRADLRGATFDLNFKQVGWFQRAIFSENQIPWVCLHPKYPEWADTLKWVKADKLSA